MSMVQRQIERLKIVLKYRIRQIERSPSQCQDEVQQCNNESQKQFQ